MCQSLSSTGDTMARTRRSAKLDSRNARLKLPSAQYYMEPLSKGQYIVYRKPKSGAAGSWSACFVNLDTKKQTRSLIAVADDFQDANGDTILDFAQAQAKAREWFKTKERQAKAEADGDIFPEGPFTVADAINAFCDDQERRGMKSADKNRRDAKNWIIPKLGHIPITRLTRMRIENWQSEISNAPRILSSKAGEEKNYAPPPKTDQEKRARKATTNRIFSILRASLSLAVDKRLVDAPEQPWRLVKSFQGVNQARQGFLSIEDQAKLVIACKSPFKELVQGALLTGCRYGELCQLRVKDFDPKNGSIYIAKTKTGMSRHVYLTDEGTSLFKSLTSKQSPESLIFRTDSTRTKRNDDGEGGWMRCDGGFRLAKACKEAGIEPLTFHELRHTYASTLVNSGCMLPVVAKLLGHVDTRMVEHVYGHLARSTVRDELRRSMPNLGITSIL